MGLTAAELRTLFTADTSDVDRAQDHVRRDSQRTSSVMSSAFRAATGFLGAGSLVALGKKSVDLEATYSKTMALMKAATGATSDEVEKLDKLAMKLGADTQFSANDAAAAMLELAKAGISTSDIYGGGLKNTLLLASAGSTDLGTAATIASNAMNTFNMRGKDMGKIAAALAGGANASSASVESLGQGLQQVGPGAKNAGLSLFETVAALSAFDAAGVKGSDAGTSLKTMLVSLVPQTKQARDAMREYGLEFVNADGSIKNLVQISGELQRGLKGLSDAERTTALATIFGADASRAASVLMDQGAAGIRKYIAATKDQKAAQELADAAMSGTSGAMEQLSGAIETAELALGKALAPTVQDVAKWLSDDAVPAVTEFIEGMQDGTGAGGDFADVLGQIVDLGKGVLELFDSLPGPVKKYGAELGIAALAMSKMSGMVGPGGLGANLRDAEARMNMLRSAATNLAGGAGLMLLADSFGETDETAQSFKRTLGGAAAGFAIGGPVGAAAGAIGGFASALFDGNEVTKDSTKSMIDYGEAIDGVTGKLKKNALQSVISSTKTENPDLFKAGGALGISDEQIGRAILGNQKAQAAIAETIRLAQKAGTVPLVPVEMEDGAKGAVDAVNLLNQALNGTITETGDGTQAVDGLVASFAEQRAEIAANAKKVRDYKAAIDGLPKKVTTLLTNDTSGDVSLKKIKDLAEKYDKTPKEVVTLLELEGYKLTVDNLKAVGLTMRQIDRLTAKPKVSTEAIDKAVNAVKNLLRLLGGAGSGGSGGGGGGQGGGAGSDGAPRRSGRGTSRALLAGALAGFETEGSKLDILEERRTIRDLQRDLRERKKIKNKKGKGYHLGGYVLTGLDRKIAETQLAEARKELQRLMGKAVDQEAVDAAAAIADQLKQTQSLLGTGTTSATQGLKNLLTNQVTNQEWLKLLAGLSRGGASEALLDEFRKQGPSKQSLALGNSILSSGLIGQYNQELSVLGAQQAQIGALGAAGSGQNTSGRALVHIDEYHANDKSAGEIASELYFRAGVER